MTAKSFLFYFFAVAAPRLGMFVVVFELARLLPLSETGLFVLVVTVGELLEMSVANWLRIYIQNREAGRNRIGALRYGRILSLTIGMTLIAIAAAIPAAWLLAGARWIEFAIAVVVYIVAFGLLRYGLNLLQTMQSHKAYARVEFARGVMILLVVAGFALDSPDTFLMPSLSLSGMTFLVALWGIRQTLPLVDRPRFVRQGIRAAARFGTPMMADTILAYLIFSFDRFVLNSVLGPAAVGIYGVAYALGRQPIDFLAGPINNITVPTLFRAYANQGEERARQIQTGTGITLYMLCAALLVGVIMLREQIVHLLLKEQFWADTVWLMPVITFASCFLIFKAYLFDNLFHMTGRTALKLRTILPVTIASVILSVGFIWWLGLKGAGIAAVLGGAMGMIASARITRRFFPFPLPWRRLASITAVAGAGALALALAVRLAHGFGDLGETILGTLAFCLVYAAGLELTGISLRRTLTRPWDPLGVQED